MKVAGIVSTGSAGRIKFVLCTFSSLAELVILNAVTRMRAKLYSFRVCAVNSLLEKNPSKQLSSCRTLDRAQAVTFVVRDGFHCNTFSPSSQVF